MSENFNSLNDSRFGIPEAVSKPEKLDTDKVESAPPSLAEDVYSFLGEGQRALLFSISLFFMPVTVPIKLFNLFLQTLVYPPIMKTLSYRLPGLDKLLNLSNMIHV